MVSKDNDRPKSRKEAIRRFCKECIESNKFIDDCESYDCPLWDCRPISLSTKSGSTTREPENANEKYDFFVEEPERPIMSTKEIAKRFLTGKKKRRGRPRKNKTEKKSEKKNTKTTGGKEKRKKESLKDLWRNIL